MDLEKYAREIVNRENPLLDILARLAAEARREGMERIVTLSEHLFGSDWAQRMRKLAQADAEKEPT